MCAAGGLAFAPQIILPTKLQLFNLGAKSLTDVLFLQARSHGGLGQSPPQFVLCSPPEKNLTITILAAIFYDMHGNV